MAVPRCTACGKAVEDGFLHVNGQGHTTTWVGGPAEKSIWGMVKLKARPRLRVFALRCISCGLIQLYAPGTPPVI